MRPPITLLCDVINTTTTTREAFAISHIMRPLERHKTFREAFSKFTATADASNATFLIMDQALTNLVLLPDTDKETHQRNSQTFTPVYID